MTVLKNCRLIPELSDGLSGLFDIVVENGRIRELLPAGSVPVNGESRDFSGCTVLPGLIDAHQHIGLFEPGDSVNNSRDCIAMDAQSTLLKASENASHFFEYGYTTIRDMCSSFRVSHFVRDGINRGLLRGPRMRSAGMIISSQSSSTIRHPDYNRTAQGYEGLLSAVREEISQGCDIVKVYNSTSFTDGGCFPLYTQEECDLIVRAAADRGKKTAVHVHDTEGMKRCLKAGFYSIEHGSSADAECIELLTKGVSHWVPTVAPLLLLKGVIEQDPGSMFADSIPRLIESTARGLEMAREAGLELGFGSDMSIVNWAKRGDYHFEFKARKELFGMENIEILRQATVINAKLLGFESECGQIKKGLSADFAVYPGNPDEDFTIMYQKPAHVFFRGEKVI